MLELRNYFWFDGIITSNLKLQLIFGLFKKEFNITFA